MIIGFKKYVLATLAPELPQMPNTTSSIWPLYSIRYFARRPIVSLGFFGFSNAGPLPGPRPILTTRACAILGHPLLLGFINFPIDFICGEQFLMRTYRVDLAIVQNNNPVRVLY